MAPSAAAEEFMRPPAAPVVVAETNVAGMEPDPLGVAPDVTLGCRCRAQLGLQLDWTLGCRLG